MNAFGALYVPDSRDYICSVDSRNLCMHIAQHFVIDVNFACAGAREDNLNDSLNDTGNVILSLNRG